MSEPANRYDAPGGGKLYRHPVTNEEFTSVTTPLDWWDKEGLLQWATGLSAEMALDYTPLLLNAGLMVDCGNTFNRCYSKHGRENQCERCPCGQCGRCLQRRIQWVHKAESSRRAQEGTELHAAVNHWVLTGGDRVTMRDEVVPYFVTFQQWVADYGLTPSSWEQSEVTVINRQHRYAGTSDAAVRFRAEDGEMSLALVKRLRDRIPGIDADALIRIDYKTREKPTESLHNDMPLQGEAYERCDTVMLPDGSEHPAPKTHARYLLQIRPDGYTFKPMVSGDRVFGVFLGLLEAYRWANEQGGKRAFDVTMPWLNPAPFQEQVKAQIDTQVQQSVAGMAAEAVPALAAAPDRARLTTHAKQALDSLAAVRAAAGFTTPPPPPPPAKKAPAKKTAAKKTAAAALPAGNPTMDFLRKGGASAWPAGQPDLTAFDDEIPF